MIGLLRARWRAFFLEVDDENAFPEGVDELRQRLRTDDDELAATILDEAQVSHTRLEQRIESAERRATTLQGASAVAASLTLAGAGLLLDPTKLTGTGWRVAFAITISYVAVAFLLCAYRATLASTKVHVWAVPPDQDVLRRNAQSLAEARTERAAALLHAIGANARNARWKVAMMRAAAEWLVRALAALLVLMLLAGAYALLAAGEPRKPQPKGPRNIPVVRRIG